MNRIILASASPRRSELLRRIQLDFTIIPSNVEEVVDERLEGAEIVKAIASQKAWDVATKLQEKALVIGADTVVMKDGVLGKPKDKNQAFAMLKRLQGEWHEVFTGVAVIDSGTGKVSQGYEKTRVKMRSLSEDTIIRYIETGEPMDKAGAYGIQGWGSLLVERIEGCYFNVVGLPLVKLSNVLEEFGVKLL